MTDCVIGLDVGTTSAKAVAFTAGGSPVATAEHGYPTHHPRPGHEEQDPDEVVDAALRATADVVARLPEHGAAAAAVSLSTAMHSLIAVDADGHALTGMLTFADNRAAEEARRLREEHGQTVYRRTGTPMHAMSTLAKLRWFRRHEPDLFTSVRRWVSGKEWLLGRLHAGEPVVDHAIASATGLLRLDTADWDDGALELAGIDRSVLARPVSTRHVLRGLRADAADATGLPTDSVIVVGASDGALANLGVGAIRPGTAAATIGTSGAIRLVTDTPSTDPAGRTFCYILTADGGSENRYLVGGAVTNGGSVLAWLQDALLCRDGEGIDDLVRDAADVPPGAGGLLVLPWLGGERAPRWRSGLSGSVLGLRSDHTRAHLVRAAMEGVLLQLRLVADAVRDTTGDIDEIRATGGFRRSALWSQMMADVLGQRIDFMEGTQAAAFGAAVLGMDAVGMIDDLEDAAGLVRVEASAHPADASVRTYRRVARTYEAVANRLLDDGVIDALADLRDGLSTHPLPE